MLNTAIGDEGVVDMILSSRQTYKARGAAFRFRGCNIEPDRS